MLRQKQTDKQANNHEGEGCYVNREASVMELRRPSLPQEELSSEKLLGGEPSCRRNMGKTEGAHMPSPRGGKLQVGWQSKSPRCLGTSSWPK